MEIRFDERNPADIQSDLLFIPITQEEIARLKNSADRFDKEVLQGLTEERVKGKLGEICHIHTTATSSKRVLLCGLGEEAKLELETIRKAYGAAARSAASLEAQSVLLGWPKGPITMKKEDIAKAIAEGFVLGSYRFVKYKEEESKKPKVSSLIINAKPELRPVIEEAMLVCKNANWVRDLNNEPSDLLHTLELTKFAEQLASEKGFKITVLDEKQLQQNGLNLIYAVGKGSKYPPRLIILEYIGNPGTEEKIALVGKGITMDTGGLNLKPTGYMETMKHDMTGAATVLGIMKTAAELKLSKNLIGVIPTCENMIGPDSYRPGDIIKSYSGKSVEITNTDAEGRLILADAIAYVEKHYYPNIIIDLATLTGSIIGTFNEHVAGLFSNDKELAKILFDCGQRTFERVWELPVYNEYEEEMKGEISDLINASESRFAGAITAAAFLKSFVQKAKWAHLDIASTAWYSKPRGMYPKGATGFGVRLIIEFLKST